MKTLLGPSLVGTLAVLALVFLEVNGQISFPSSSGGGSRLPQKPFSPRPHSPRPKQNDVKGCNCLPKAKCPSGFGQLGMKCIDDHGKVGICCIPQQGLVLTRVGFDASDVAPMNIPSNVVQQGFQSGQSFFNELMQQDRDRFRSGSFLGRGEPARGHAFFFNRNPSAVRINELAYTIARGSIDIASSQSLTPQQSFFGLPTTRFGPSGVDCPLDRRINCDGNSKFRTIDGSCNNLRKPILGKSETGFGRILPALYPDGIMNPRTTAVDGEPLPNVRVISNTILLDVDVPDSEFTLGVMQWAQFIDHDLTHAPFPAMVNVEAIQCCEDGRLVIPQPEFCFTIDISPDDGFYKRSNQQCINFVRSMLALNEGCRFGPVEQLNALTHYVDGSMIYGSTEEEEERVVDVDTGLLKVSANGLPPTNASVDCEARIRSAPCFVAGDSRINEQPALTVLHTLWVREHNRIASILSTNHPDWDANRLFQETRRIVVAVVQHINYNEFLPIIIGQKLMGRLGINTLDRGFRTTYNPNVDPRMTNEFATAAFRFGHSLVQGLFRLISNTRRQGTARLRDVFNAPNILQDNPELVDSYVNSLTLQNIQTLDNLITQELSNHLFQTPSFNFGMDLMSLNLQRGRDHAISTYNQMREEFRIGRATSFADLLNTTPRTLIRRLQAVYRNPDDIDLFVGGMTEKPLSRALLGPTFANIVGTQFRDVMNGDRFFYDNGGQAGSFTPRQLQEIRKSSLANLYCDNSGVPEMQKKAFDSVKPGNLRVPCSNIPGMDLSVF